MQQNVSLTGFISLLVQIDLIKRNHPGAEQFDAGAAILLPLADRIETITYDNGKEFASHAEIVAALGAKSYFAKPYHSWERGLNKHTNGLVRQYFPKGTDFSTLSNADVQWVEDKLNFPPPQDTRLPNPKRGFPDGRLTCLLHFTVEWADAKVVQTVWKLHSRAIFR